MKGGGWGARRAVMSCHVGFDFFGISAWGRVPARFFGVNVEVVGEVFGVGMADFPLSGETGFVGGL